MFLHRDQGVRWRRTGSIRARRTSQDLGLPHASPSSGIGKGGATYALLLNTSPPSMADEDDERECWRATKSLDDDAAIDRTASGERQCCWRRRVQ